MPSAPVEFTSLRPLDSGSHWLLRAIDFGRLAKPRLTALAVFAALIGYLLASQGQIVLHSFFGLLTGAFLVGGGANALNQFAERRWDGLMKRTQDRPLPAKRLVGPEAHAFGVLLCSGGVGLLMVYCNFLTAVLAGVTLVAYLCLYTPLKRVSAWSTLVGAIPGALPVLMGWSAFDGRLSWAAWTLFAILFVWQLPHFWAICWLYREDYRAAGFVMTPLNDVSGRRTARQALAMSLAVAMLSLLPPAFGLGGRAYFIGAALLGLGMLGFALRFCIRTENKSARALFLATIFYLPLLMGLLLVDHLA